MIIYTLIIKIKNKKKWKQQDANQRQRNHQVITLPLRHRRITKVIVRGSVSFLIRRDRDF